VADVGATRQGVGMVEGIGIGFREGMAEGLLASSCDALQWVEIHPENYIERGGKFESLLGRAMERWPIVTHGLTQCFGSLEPYDEGFLRSLRSLLDQVGTPWHSDHLCFAGVDGTYMHDLLPLPLTQESVGVVVDRVKQMQDALGRPVALEHISYYAHPPGAEMDDVEHLVEILERADAKLLLDVNNVYVNSQNHDFDPRAWIDRIPTERVVQLHMAGHLVRPDGTRIDTHGEPICEGTFELFEYTMRRLNRPIGVLLERDGNFPPIAELISEVERLDGIYRAALGSAASGRDPEVHA
jgi:uncharacterized protein (UPF0276 family)